MKDADCDAIDECDRAPAMRTSAWKRPELSASQRNVARMIGVSMFCSHATPFSPPRTRTSVPCNHRATSARAWLGESSMLTRLLRLAAAVIAVTIPVNVR